MDGRFIQKDKRISVACEECRKRKRKCDGLRPTCTSCAVAEKDCQYAGTVETRKRKQWDTEYVTGLEDEVATLRKLVADLERTTDQSRVMVSEPMLKLISESNSLTPLNDPLLSAEKQEHTPKGGSSRTPDHARGQSVVDDDPAGNLSSSAIDDLSALVWQMNIGDQGEPAFIGPSGNFCFPSSSSVPLDTSFDIRHSPSTQTEQPSEQDHCNIYMMKRLTSLFLSELNPVHQFIPPSTVLMPDQYPFEDSSLTLLHSAAFSAGALFSSVPEEQAAGHFFASLVDEGAIKAAREHPSVRVVQALALLAWRELSQEHNNIAQVYIAMAGGLVMSLGLHVIGLEALSESHPSKIVLERDKITRVRTFWSFFLLDRIATSILGRNTILPWRRIDVPVMSGFLDSTSSIEEVVFSYQCKLWDTHDQFMDQIYSFNFGALQFAHRNRLLLSARAALLAFKQALPQALRAPTQSSSPNTPKTVLFLHMSYQMSLILIHRPYLREPPGSSSFTLALATMSSAATRMTQYIQTFNRHHIQIKSTKEPASAPPFIIHHILSASVVHLLLGTAQIQSQKTFARRKLQICMEALGSLQGYWSTASKAIAQIQNLAVQWKVVGVLPLRWSFVVKAETSRNTDDPDITVSAAKTVPDPDFAASQSFLSTTSSADPQVYPQQVDSVTQSQLDGQLDSNFGAWDLGLDPWSNTNMFDVSEYNFEMGANGDPYADFVPTNYDAQLYPELSAVQDVFDIDFSSWPQN